MPAKISSERPIRRETSILRRQGGKQRPILVELHPGYLLLRLKNTRDSFMLDYGAAFEYAAKISAIGGRP